MTYRQRKRIERRLARFFREKAEIALPFLRYVAYATLYAAIIAMMGYYSISELLSGHSKFVPCLLLVEMVFMIYSTRAFDPDKFLEDEDDEDWDD